MRYKKNEESALNKIYNATAELMQEMDYAKINCSMIIKRANVSRSTFYTYFKAKESIITYICDDIFNRTFKTKTMSAEKQITESFTYFYSKKEIILPILNSGSSSIFLQRLRKRLKSIVIELINHGVIGKSNIPLDLKIHQYINGYTALLQYYLRHGNDMSPEVVSSYYFAFYK